MQEIETHQFADRRSVTLRGPVPIEIGQRLEAADMGAAEAAFEAAPCPFGFAHGQGHVFRASPVGGFAGAPGIGLGIEIGQVDKAAAGKEGLSDVADGPLNAPFLISSVHRHGPWLIAVMPGEMQQRRVESDRLALSLQDGALEIVIEENSRQAGPGREGGGMTAQEILHAGIEKEAQKDLSRPRQHHHESHQRPPGAADLEMAKVTPVRLALFTGQRAQPQVPALDPRDPGTISPPDREPAVRHGERPWLSWTARSFPASGRLAPTAAHGRSLPSLHHPA